MAVSEREVAFLSATELRARFAAGDLSPVEAAEALLGRIERLNPDLVAFVTVTGERALADARNAEDAYRAGDAGPLAGVPVSIKDITPTKGIRTTRGSLLDADWIPDEDPPLVERLYAAGAVMLGKTNTPELGWKGDSGNRVVGPTHNPWRYGRTAGGSSGGAAAAVAAGLGPLAHGTDGAGSIRIPAAFCGVFGMKPSFGLVPMWPISAVGDVAHHGPITRTVRDAALMLDVMAGADQRDRFSWSNGANHLQACDDTNLRGVRVAWSPTLGYAAVAPDVAARAAAAAARFVDLGCDVEEVDPGLPDPWQIAGAMWTCAMGGYFCGRIEELGDRLDPGLRRVVERAARYSGADLAAAQQARNAYADGMRRFFERYDLLLTPTLPVTAFAAGLDEPPRTDERDETPLDWTPFTYPFNLTGQPAATVPCGFTDDGLPVGLQIVGRWHDDASVLRAAVAFEAVAPWADRLPPDS
jgi:aspartyl-tRNA(Asn)/glutamyl-tRNA(Gln) amidotransferase subunit A